MLSLAPLGLILEWLFRTAGVLLLGPHMYLVGIHVDAQRAEASGRDLEYAHATKAERRRILESRREAMLAEAERRKADELGMDVSKFKHGIKGVPVEQPLASGLKWECVGTTEPRTGVELTEHDALAEAIHTRAGGGEDHQHQAGDEVEFTQLEWADLAVGGLRADHYVEVGGAYYRPARWPCKCVSCALLKRTSARLDAWYSWARPVAPADAESDASAAASAPLLDDDEAQETARTSCTQSSSASSNYLASTARRGSEQIFSLLSPLATAQNGVEPASGLKWERADGVGQPAGTIELVNQALSDALRSKLAAREGGGEKEADGAAEHELHLAESEWASMGVGDGLQMNHVVLVTEGVYFQPAERLGRVSLARTLQDKTRYGVLKLRIDPATTHFRFLSTPEPMRSSAVPLAEGVHPSHASPSAPPEGVGDDGAGDGPHAAKRHGLQRVGTQLLGKVGTIASTGAASVRATTALVNDVAKSAHDGVDKAGRSVRSPRRLSVRAMFASGKPGGDAPSREHVGASDETRSEGASAAARRVDAENAGETPRSPLDLV